MKNLKVYKSFNNPNANKQSLVKLIRFGASFAPLIATKLATTYGLHAVGYYLTAASLLSLCAFLMIRETKNDDVNNQI